MTLKSEEELFFEDLLEKTKAIFYESETYKENKNENWNFAICETPIQRGVGVFFGLNWGGDNKNAQSEYPKKDKKRNWNFISHSRKYFRKYLETEIEDLNYSNLCFIRTPKAHKLHKDDWSITIPFFKKYIDFINPPWTLLLGNPENINNEHLNEKKEIQVIDTKNNKTVYGYTGRLFGIYPFGAVPHPQARVSKEARHDIWLKVIQRMLSIQKSMDNNSNENLLEG